MFISKACEGYKVVNAHGTTIARFKGHGAKRRAIKFVRLQTGR